MSNITKSGNFSLTPSNLEEAMKFADIMAKSTIVPKQYQGRPGDILVAVQMGADLGLKPMQALQNIAVINGRPSIWGDSLLALVQAHPAFEDIEEFVKDNIATCIVKRKGQSAHTVTFSVEDAKKAGLWGKSGPWTSYPYRMLQLRARGFALRDRFADALGGLITTEEAQDYPVETKDITPEQQRPNSKTSALLNKLDNILDDDIPMVEASEVSEREKLVFKLADLVTNKKLDEAMEKTCDKYGIASIYQMTEEQLNKAIEWAEERQGE